MSRKPLRGLSTRSLDVLDRDLTEEDVKRGSEQIMLFIKRRTAIDPVTGKPGYYDDEIGGDF